MMEDSGSAGYIEFRHTADLCLKVWASNFTNLLSQAIWGMQSLMGLDLRLEPEDQRLLVFTGLDMESLLVAALNEVLYLIESERLGVIRCDAALDGLHLSLTLGLSTILRLDKEIKAVTYHALSIQKTENGVDATLVFDV